jgi:cytochrome c5
MRRAAVIVTILVVAIAAACGGAIPHATPAQVERARTRWPDASAAALERGRELYVARCSGCHSLVEPSKHHAAFWTARVSEMAPRAKLTPEEVHLVTHYLVTVSETEIAIK